MTRACCFEQNWVFSHTNNVSAPRRVQFRLAILIQLMLCVFSALAAPKELTGAPFSLSGTLLTWIGPLKNSFSHMHSQPLTLWHIIIIIPQCGTHLNLLAFLSARTKSHITRRLSFGRAHGTCIIFVSFVCVMSRCDLTARWLLFLPWNYEFFDTFSSS